MKIRIKGDSIRYRLTRPEIERFAVEGVIREKTHFDTQILSYVLKLTGGEDLYAEFKDDTITVYMPRTMADEWTATERVGFANEENQLAIYVEKDFQCLDNVAEDQSDNYPNPLAVHRHEDED